MAGKRRQTKGDPVAVGFDRQSVTMRNAPRGGDAGPRTQGDLDTMQGGQILDDLHALAAEQLDVSAAASR